MPATVINEAIEVLEFNAATRLCVVTVAACPLLVMAVLLRGSNALRLWKTGFREIVRKIENEREQWNSFETNSFQDRLSKRKSAEINQRCCVFFS